MVADLTTMLKGIWPSAWTPVSWRMMSARILRTTQPDRRAVAGYLLRPQRARSLGFLLVEGEDLTVRDDGVFIRTVSGLNHVWLRFQR